MTQDEYMKLRAYAIATGKLDRFVVLKEDENGRYIEYAFQEGAPHDNRCLSWYDKLQPKALERNGHDLEVWKQNYIKKTDTIYELSLFSCGHQELPVDDEEHCSAGHPRKKCMDCQCKHWTYDEPVKCACWFLRKLKDINEYSLTPDEAVVFADILSQN